MESVKTCDVPVEVFNEVFMSKRTQAMFNEGIELVAKIILWQSTYAPDLSIDSAMETFEAMTTIFGSSVCNAALLHLKEIASE